MQYTNYLTTPSGRYCEVRDITNEQYLIMVKFIQSQNYKKFFEYMDYVVKQSIKDVDDFDIIQRCYVYIAMCMYSIRATLAVTNTMLGSQQIPLSVILNNIESSYTPNNIVQYNLNDKVTLKFSYPKKFSYEGEAPIIDFYSGLVGYNDVVLNEQQKQQLKQKLGTKQLSFIDDYLREKFTSMCDIFQGIPMNNFQLNIVSESLIANVVGFYKMPLDSFYRIMYTVMKHIKMSYSDFMKVSYLEGSLFIKYAVQESNKMNEQAKKGNINLSANGLDE